MNRDYIDKIKHVFVVDDNEYKLEHLCNTMKEIIPNAEIHDFSYANEFLKYINDTDLLVSSPSETCVILLDMQMPHVQFGDIDVDCGYHVLARLERHAVRCPVIIVSSAEVNSTRALGWYEYYTGAVYYSPRQDPKDSILKLLDKSVEDRKRITKMRKAEKRLQNLVKSIPIVLEYGCHTIELKPDTRTYSGFTFRAIEIKDGKLVIRHC